MLAILFASRIINDKTGEFTFEVVPRLLKQPVAEILIEGGLPELVPVEFGGTMQTE